MIGCCLVQSDTQERADPQRISGTPRHPPLTVNTFEIAHHQQPKVDARCKSRPTERLRIEPLTQAFYKLIKMAFVQQSVEPFVERMAGRTRQCRRRNPQLLLPLPLLPGPHRHTRFYAQTLSMRYVFFTYLHLGQLGEPVRARLRDRSFACYPLQPSLR